MVKGIIHLNVNQNRIHLQQKLTIQQVTLVTVCREDRVEEDFQGHSEEEVKAEVKAEVKVEVK